MQQHSLRDAVRFWRKSPLLIAVLVVELLLLLSAVRAAVQPPVHYAFTPEQLEDIAGEDVTLTYDENGYYGVTYDIDGQDILQTPALSLVPGNYRATVTYAYQPTRTPEGRIHHSNVQLMDPANDLSVAEGALVLDEHRNEQTVLMSVYQPTDTARVVFHDDGGKYTVGGITIRQDMGYAALCAVWVLLCCLAVDAVLLCILPKSPCYRGPGWAAAFLILGCAVMFASAPLMQPGFDLGGMDSIYHLQRIEGIAQGLRDGQFPVRLNSVAKGGYGYANSMFYGELFLYFPALLRLMGVSVQDAYKLYAMGVQILTAVIAYRSFRPIFGSRPALAGSVLYLLCPYRMHRFYNPMAVGEYTGMAFLPAVIYGIWLLYRGTPAPAVRHRAMLVLALAYSALLQCHMISLEFAVLLAAAVCLVFWRKTFRPAVLLTWLKAAGLALLLNLWFLVPFATGMLSGSYGRVSALYIQRYGLTPADLFYNNQDFAVGLPLLLCGCCAAFVLCTVPQLPAFWRRVGWLSLAGGAAAVLLTTRLFPWNALSSVPLLGRLLQVVQFPWRYSSLAALGLLLALLSAAAGLAHLSRAGAAHRMLAMCVCAAVASTALYWNSYLPQLSGRTHLVDGSQLAYEHSYNPTNNLPMDLDELYIPSAAVETADGFAHDQVVTSVTTGDFVREDKGVTSVEYDEYLGQDGHVEFPLLYYPGYKVVEGTGTIFETANGMVGVLVPANSSGRLAVAFREPLRWRLADLVSLAAALGLAGYCAARHFRRRRSAPLPPTARRAGQR